MLKVAKHAAPLCIGLILGLAAPHVLAQPAKGSFDGTYKGPASSTSGGNCREFRALMKVEGGAISIRYNAELTITGNVASSGAVTGQGTGIYSKGRMITTNLTGSIAGTTATLTSESPACHYDFKLTKE